MCGLYLGHFLPGGRRLWDAACPAWLLWRAWLCPPSSLCAQGWLRAGSVVNRPKGWKRKRDSLLSSFGFFVSAVQSDQSSPGDVASCSHHPRSSASHANSHYWAIPTAALLPWTHFVRSCLTLWRMMKEENPLKSVHVALVEKEATPVPLCL